MTRQFLMSQETKLRFRLPSPSSEVLIQCEQSEDPRARAGIPVAKDIPELNFIGWIICRRDGVISLHPGGNIHSMLPLRFGFDPPLAVELTIAADSGPEESYSLAGVSLIEINSRSVIIQEEDDNQKPAEPPRMPPFRMPRISWAPQPQPQPPENVRPSIVPPAPPVPEPAQPVSAPAITPAMLAQDEGMFGEEFLKLDAAAAQAAAARYRQAVRADMNCAKLLGLESVKGRLALLDQELSAIEAQLRVLIEQREKTAKEIQQAIAYGAPLKKGADPHG